LKAQILRKASIPEIESASGMEVIRGMIYIVANNSTELICLDPYLNIKYRLALTNETKLPEQPGNELTAMCSFEINNFSHLLILPPGSISGADKACLIKLPTPYNRRHLVRKRELEEFYNLLRINDSITSTRELSIRCVTAGNDFIALFNPGQSHNSVMYFYKEEFIEFIQGDTESVPFPLAMTFELPRQLSPSGISVFDDKLFWSAFHTRQHASFDQSCIGWKPLRSFERIRGMMSIPVEEESHLCQPEDPDAGPYMGHISSICVTDQPEANVYSALALGRHSSGKTELLLMDVYIY